LRLVNPRGIESGDDAFLECIADVVQKLVDRDNTSAALSLRHYRPEPAGICQARSVGTAAQLQVFARDHFSCRYCGRKTLFVPILRLLSSTFPDLLPYHLNWKMSECHIAYWRFGASCDHVTPAARGGSSEPANLVTSCYMCNSMKQNWLVEELRWQIRPPTSTCWDGLAGYYPRLCAVIDAGQQSVHKKWLAAVRVVLSDSGTADS
jgi:5-methylcytosine-specific restriction endonuclease McrA